MRIPSGGGALGLMVPVSVSRDGADGNFLEASWPAAVAVEEKFRRGD
jgi:hypothetical protein